MTDEVGSLLRRNVAGNLGRASSQKTQILVQALISAGPLLGGAMEGRYGGQI